MNNLYQLLEQQARIHGNKTALSNGQESLTFSQLRDLSARMSARLASQGVNSGQKIYVLMQPNIEWIATAALFHRGCVSCSAHPGAVVGDELPFTPDWIFTDRDGIEGENVIRIDQAWFNGLGAYPADQPAARYEADECVRIILTSGTTGIPKGAPLSLNSLRHRVEQLIGDWVSPLGDGLNLMPLSTIGGLSSALYSWRAGRPYFTVFSEAGLVGLLARTGMSCLTGSPAQISKFLQIYERERTPLPALKEIRMAGSAVSPRLLNAILQTFNVDVYSIYGSTEAGGTGMVKLDSPADLTKTAYVRPQVDVEIVNENDEVLLPGAEGIVRVRSAANISGYLNDVDADAFRDGWFYPGDRGSLSSERLLTLSAREAEVINRGGEKISPVLIDNFLQSYPGIEDAAVFGVENKLGVAEVAAALVIPEDFDIPALQAALRAEFNPVAVPQHLFRVNSVPRNQMGKPLRVQMAASFREQLVAAGRPGF